MIIWLGAVIRAIRVIRGLTALSRPRQFPEKTTAYSSGMPQAPAAISRRFIAGEVRTAPIAFNFRRISGSEVARPFISSGDNLITVCLTRIVLVVRFEVVDGMVKGLVEGHLGQPEFLAEIAVRRQHILMSDPVGRVESGNESITICGASHQQDDERHHRTLDGSERHCDVAVFIEPGDKRFVAHFRGRFTHDPESDCDEPSDEN